MGIEDALAMASAMQAVSKSPTGAASIPAALQAFSAVHLERSQWLVQSSREMGVISSGGILLLEMMANGSG